MARAPTADSSRSRYCVGSPDRVSRSDERSIRPCEAGTGDLALEHGQLMAQHEDLGVLRHSVHPMNADRFEHAVNEAVEEGERHRRRASPSRSYLVKPPDE